MITFVQDIKICFYRTIPTISCFCGYNHQIFTSICCRVFAFSLILRKSSQMHSNQPCVVTPKILFQCHFLSSRRMSAVGSFWPPVCQVWPTHVYTPTAANLVVRHNQFGFFNSKKDIILCSCDLAYREHESCAEKRAFLFSFDVCRSVLRIFFFLP